MGSRGPNNLVDAELLRQGRDPDAVDIETKRRISEDLIKAFEDRDGLRVGLPVQGKPRDLQGQQLPLL